MGQLNTVMLLVFAIASGLTVLAMLRVFTNIVEHETDLHDLRNRIKQLQFERQLYLARLHGHIGPEIGEVEILDDDPIEAVEQAQHAADQVAELLNEPQPQAA